MYYLHVTRVQSQFPHPFVFDVVTLETNSVVEPEQSLGHIDDSGADISDSHSDQTAGWLFDFE